MTDTSTEAVTKRADFLASAKGAKMQDVADLLRALAAERDELAAALDSHHAEVGSNIWRFWRDKAREPAGENTRLRALAAERDKWREEWRRMTAERDAALMEAALIGASSYGADMDAEALILALIPDAGGALDRAIAEAVQIVLDDVGYTFDQLGEKAQRKLRNRIEGKT